MAKPATDPRWAETAGGVAAANIVAPNAGKQDAGYALGGDVVPSGWLNWTLYWIWQWVKWVKAGTAAATASTLMERDANGRSKAADPGAVDDVDTQGARDTAIAAHNAATAVHGAAYAATPDRLMLRDANGRCKAADPVWPDEVDTRGRVEASIAGRFGSEDIALNGSWIAATSGLFHKKVAKAGTVCVLSLAVSVDSGAITAAWSPVGTVPIGYRPQTTVNARCTIHDSSAGKLYEARAQINTDGTIAVVGYDAGNATIGETSGVFAIGNLDALYLHASWPLA